MILRIRNWADTFENAASKKLVRLAWVAIPNKTDGEGYTALVDHPQAAAHLGAWYAIVEAASKQSPRGNLPGGIPQDIGGICRSLGRMSRLPGGIFQEVIPRLIEIGWLEWIQQDGETSGESPKTLAESPNVVAESAERIEQNRIELKGTEQKHTEAPKSAALSVREFRDRFPEFIEPWDRVKNPDHAARAYLSCIDNAGDEELAFSARDRYLASDEVSRGVWTDPVAWLMDQKSAKWGGKWPAAKARAPAGKESVVERAAARMLQRAIDGGRP